MTSRNCGAIYSTTENGIPLKSVLVDQHKGDTLTKCPKSANICNTKHNDIASVAQSI